MRLALCEDEKVYTDGFLSLVEQWKSDTGREDVYTYTYVTAENLLDAWQAGLKFDIVFLDIQLAGMSGMELAQQIRALDQTVPIVFITGNEQFVFQGYSVSAFRYLMKPVQKVHLYECLDKAAIFIRSMQERSIILQVEGAMVTYQFRDVLCFGSHAHVIDIYTTQGQHKTSKRMQLEDLIDQLPENQFIRCHRLFVVNMQHVRRIQRQSLFLNSNLEIPISRKYLQSTKEAFEKLYIGGMFNALGHL